MSEAIDFDAAAARVARAYQTADVIQQRERVAEVLDLQPGESILDIGSGPGLLLEELAQHVGPQGRACGIDLADGMVEMGRRRCAELPQVTVEVADASTLPFDDTSFDAACSTQVYEYVEDMPKALDDLARVIKPGGRVAILDTDYDSLVMEFDDRALHQRVLSAWDEHFVHADLPRKLSPLLRSAGFVVRNVEAIPIVNTEYADEHFSWHLTTFMASFAAGRAGVRAAEANTWRDELERLADAGRYFFSINRYLVVADKP